MANMRNIKTGELTASCGHIYEGLCVECICRDILDPHKEELAQKEARISQLGGDNPELESFIKKIVSEIAISVEADHKKGDTQKWVDGVAKWLTSLSRHYENLEEWAVKSNYPFIKEYCENFGYVAFFIAVNPKALSDKSNQSDIEDAE